MNSDELKLIKTLANESEKISTNDNFFALSTINETSDQNVSGWQDTKTLTLSGFNSLPPIHMPPASLRHTQLDSFSKIRLDSCLKSTIRLKLSQDRSKSITLTRASVYKTNTLAISENVSKKFFSQSVDRRPKLPNIKKNTLLSMYLPFKRRKKHQNPKANLATVDDLLPLLQPALHNSITKKIISDLRSKADLNKTLSKQQLNRVSHSLSV